LIKINRAYSLLILSSAALSQTLEHFNQSRNHEPNFEPMKILQLLIVITMFTALTATAHEGEAPPPGPGLFGQPPEYIHTLLNPLPVYGLSMGVLALMAALFTRSRAAKGVALGIIILTSAAAWPVLHYGQNGYQNVSNTSDEEGRRWLAEHMARAAKFIWGFYATALLGVAALVSLRKFPKAANPLTVTTLIVAVISLGVGAWVSRAGGQIHHPEFRHEPAPLDSSSASEDHHSSEANQ